MSASLSGNRVKLGVLSSGRGSNLQAILDASAAGPLHAEVVVVISDRERAPALERARAASVSATFLDPKAHEDRGAFDLALRRTLEAHRVDLVCLAGFMRLLGADFVRAFRGRVVNIHPSLLPAFPGLAAQRQALDHGVKVSGASVHFVDEGLDTGPIILQEAVPVVEGDTEESLSRRILEAEHRIYPAAIRLYAEGRLRIVGRRVVIASSGDVSSAPSSRSGAALAPPDGVSESGGGDRGGAALAPPDV